MKEKKESVIFNYYKELHSEFSLSRMNCRVETKTEEWESYCQNIANNQLKGLSLYFKNLDTMSTEQWKMLWAAIQSSQVELLDLNHNDIGYSKNFKALWKGLCEGIKGSNLKSLNLKANYLFKLDAEDWQNFSFAMQKVKLESLNLSSNFFYYLVRENEEISSSWKAFCEIIKESGIQHLILRENCFAKLSLPAFSLLCEGLANSSLKKLDIDLSYHSSLSQEAWFIFINCLRSSKLNSLKLAYHDPTEFSGKVFAEFCMMLQASSLNALHVNNYFDSLSLTNKEWLLLAQALKARNINTFDIGRIDLEERNINGFLQSILPSNVQAINLQNNNLNALSPNLWHSLAQTLESAGIQVLNLRGSYMSYASKEVLNNFFTMITSSKIKALYLICNNFWNFDSEEWDKFCSTIENSSLEFLSMSFGQNYYEIKPLWPKWKKFENSIKASRLTYLNLNDENYRISMPLEKSISTLQSIINNRARYQHTLLNLCALTLFNQYKGRFSDNTLIHENKEKQWKTDLTTNEIEVIKETWFKPI